MQKGYPLDQEMQLEFQVLVVEEEDKEEYPVLEVLKGPVGQSSDSHLVTLKVVGCHYIIIV